MNTAEFLEACEQRGKMTLRDHLASTSVADIPDVVAEKKLRGAVWGALKTAKYAHLVNIILKDRGEDAARSNLPTLARPASVETATLEEIRHTNAFRLPSVPQKLEAATKIIAKHSSRVAQQTIGSAISALNDERVLERAEKEAEARANKDKDAELEASRRREAWMQTMMQNMLPNGGNGGGKNLK